MRALVAGATGMVGESLVRQLLDDERYTEVCVIGRRASGVAHAKWREHIADFDALDKLPADIKPDQVFCCLGTTIKTAGSKEAFERVDLTYVANLGALAKARGASSFVLISAVGADANSTVFYSRIKGQAEDAIEALGLESSCALRPSLLLGKRREFRLGERLFMPAAQLLSPLLHGPLRKYRPVHADEVARQMILAANAEQTGHRVKTCT